MIEKIYQIFLESSGICTDTRNISEGNLFIALHGPNFNANKFAAKAIEKGAIGALIDDKSFAIPGKTIYVEDGLLALQELAKIHRNTLKIPIIGITGSNGKTTTKELVHAVLSSTFQTYATKGNLNNHIGVPLSVLSITQDHDLAIIEMGANHLGEIALLSSISRPTHGLITNIGKAHTGLFGGFEGVIRAKSELYDFLIKNKGIVFINQNQEILMNMSKRIKNPVLYPNSGSDYPCSFLGADPFVEVKTEQGNVIKTHLVGKYNFDNIATALCIGKYFKVPEDQANNAISSYTPDNNRSQILKKGSNTIILDAYNANPSSMEKALENLAQMNAKSKIAIIGDMFELGEDTKSEHEMIGKMLKKLNIQDAIFCGESMKYAYDTFGKGNYMKTRDLLTSYLIETKFSDSTILIKASRGMALEQIVDYLDSN
ncbi:MAG: UDP-N-acetylmuramoyl-tripeptide--D-alanyl-D-alanine ligase [Cyclobacteriaceae bacterium]|nr:UDP-N-acetylmuramoyl-tripeptide--D-alanyl-D-alanine ligase [Cyclobacteriaceae bacterium]